MYQVLLSYGLVPAKSLILQYPTCISDTLQRHFIRGYFDGDGTMYIGENGQNCNFLSAYDFCYKAKEIIESNIGVYVGMYRYRNNISYSLQISGRRQVLKFLTWLYYDSDLYLIRKYKKFHQGYEINYYT